VAIVRNPGGRAAGAIKALAGMQAVLNCGTIIVVHHTGKSKPIDGISNNMILMSSRLRNVTRH
jgi:hypothetical protein